jgi:hypothetical protein
LTASNFRITPRARHVSGRRRHLPHHDDEEEARNIPHAALADLAKVKSIDTRIFKPHMRERLTAMPRSREQHEPYYRDASRT